MEATGGVDNSGGAADEILKENQALELWVAKRGLEEHATIRPLNHAVRDATEKEGKGSAGEGDQPAGEEPAAEPGNAATSSTLASCTRIDV